MPRYDRSQALAFDLNTLNKHPLTGQRLYEFPAEWAGLLREKVFPSTDPDQPRSIPLWATNEAIAMLLPQVLTHDARGRAGTPWLAWGINDGSPEPDPQLLVELVRGGLIAAALDRNEKAARWHRPPAVDLTALQEVLATFQPSHLKHTVRTLEIRRGHELDPVDYTLIAQMLATHLVTSGWHVEHSEYAEQEPMQLLAHAIGPLVAIGVVTIMPIIWTAFAGLDHGLLPAGPTPARCSQNTPNEPTMAERATDGRTALLVKRAQQLIADGQLPAAPSASRLRDTLHCGTDAAREVRDVLRSG